MIFTKPILFDYLEKLLRGKKHLGAILYSHTPSENDLHVPQKSPGEANGNFSSLQFCFAYGQAVSQTRQAFYKTKARPPNRFNKIS